MSTPGVRDVVIPQLPEATVAKTTAVAEGGARLGYRAVWFGETAGFDAGVLAGRLSNQVPGMKLVVGPLPAPFRTGPQLAMLAGSLAAYGVDAEIVLGASSPAITSRWNGLRATSVALLRDTIAAARQGLSGERTQIDGGLTPTVGFRSSFPAPQTPIGLAALGPRTLELAGALADRVVLNFASPESAPALLAHIEAGAASAGRARPPVTIWMHTAVEATSDGVEVARRFVSGYLRAPGYIEEFERQGFGEITRAASEVPTRELSALVSDDLLHGLFAMGTAAEAQARAVAYEALGIEVAVVPLTQGDPEGLRSLEALRPAAPAAVAEPVSNRS